SAGTVTSGARARKRTCPSSDSAVLLQRLRSNCEASGSPTRWWVITSTPRQAPSLLNRRPSEPAARARAAGPGLTCGAPASRARIDRQTASVAWPPVRALILDSRDARASLAAVRGLARGGWTVGVAAPSPTLASASRHVRRRHRVPLPEDGEDAFVEALSAAVAEQGYEVVFASSDEDMLALASAPRDRLPARGPYPPRPVLG